MQETLSHAASQKRIISYLRRLGNTPPNVLLLEGGSREQREELGLFWAALLNCSSGDPCGDCPTCRQIGRESYRDLYVFRGQEDSIKVDDVRPLRQVLADKPYEAYRVVLFSEAQELTVPAANALLKSLEEPLSGNVFVLLAPQRHLLLSTLVSRSYPFTLSQAGMQTGPEEESEVVPWLESLLRFWQSGTGLFEHTGQKKAVDRHLLGRILLAMERELHRAYLGEDGGPLAAYLRRHLAPLYWARLDMALAKAEEIVRHQVNPALILEWLALTVWRWLREQPARDCQ
ncbi:MAG: DNA polymerase III subunit delta' [Desulfohalobiaceae bacterium]|nr:DNA polymerase III subunit delta' [Desulfohalobiaceae bacterium]